MKYIKGIFILTLSLCIFVFVGCSNKNKNEGVENMKIVKVAGSTTVFPLMQNLKNGYERQIDPNVRIEIQQTGSSSGIMSVSEGISQIAMTSRDLTEKEKESGLSEIKIALDGIILIINNDNNINNLTMDQIKKIFSGEITNWNEVGGHDGKIIVISRENGSGTKASFEELTNLKKQVIKGDKIYMGSLISKDALFENNAGAIKSDVMYSKNMIGYISIGNLDKSVKALSVDGFKCLENTVKNGEYKIARPFKLAVNFDNLDETSKDFINYILSDEGQKIVSKSGYISVN